MKVILLVLLSLSVSAQTLYYRDTFKGGITGSGYSPRFDIGGTGAINLTYSGSNRQCYLLAGRHGLATDITVTLNGNSLIFNAANQVSSTFQSPSYGGNSGVHSIDVTGIVISGANTLIVPAQGGPSDRYNDFYIYVAFNDAFAATITASVFLNTHNFSLFTDTYSFTTAVDVVPGSPISFAEFGGYVCDNTTDGNRIRVNGTLLGTYGGTDVGSGVCGCCKSSFEYLNGVLTAYNNNNPNQSMGVSNMVDVTSDIKALVTGTSFTASYAPVSAGNTTNAHWASFITYSTTDSVVTACDSVSNRTVTNITANSATLNWDAVVGAVSYTVSWRKVGDVIFNFVVTASTSTNISFLTPNTQYEWRVATSCSGGSNSTLLQDFTTLDLVQPCCGN